MNFDYTLYLVTDRQLMSCDSLTEAVEQAILGGCTMIQLREKELSSLEFYNQAVAVKQVTDKYHIPLIINDRIDIAMAVQATGVHIGQHDLPAAAVRKVIGVEGIIEEWNNMAVEEYSNHVGLLPHALDYLLRLKEHGIKLAVATGLPEKLYIPCLKNNSILELFDALCSTDEVQRGKEYSDVFELAARKLGVAPEHCIVFDDVLPAIKSAKAARMLAGGIYDKYSADQRTEIERIADIYLLDFRQAPIPHKEV